MDREGFRNRLKQYKKAREENPGLKYLEWKNLPKYDEGTEGVMGPPTYEEQVLQNNKNSLNIFDKIALEESIAVSKDALNQATNDLYKRISGRDRYERAAHHTSAGSIENLISYVWDSNPQNVPNYTGSYKKRYDNNSELIRSGVQGNAVQTQLGTLVAADANVDRDLVKNFIYGEDQGFIKSKKKPITVNGIEYKDRQYEGNIAPYDTLFFPKSMQPTIDSLVQGKDIFSVNHNSNYIPSVYEQYKQETYDQDNVAKHSGVIKKQNNNYFTTVFDLWDFLGDYSYAPDWLAHKFQNDLQPDQYFPNAGPFVLRQDIPIKFVEDSVLDQTRPSGRYFLENLNITPNKNGKRNKASVKLKEFTNLWNTDLGKIKKEKLEKTRESVRKIKLAKGGEVKLNPYTLLWT